MSKYLNVCTPVTDKNDKVRFEKVGVAFPSRDNAKSEMTIRLHGLPVNGELVLFAPRQSDKED